MRRSVSGARLVWLLILTPLAAAPARAQTADEIVARNVEAKGGIEKWKTLSSVKLSGRMMREGQELPLTIYSKRPNLMRREIALPGGKMVQGFDGTTAWILNPQTNQAMALPTAAADVMRTTGQFEGPLIDYKAKGHTVELVGREQLDGADVHHLTLTMKGGEIQHYYLDAKTGLEVRMTQELDAGPAGRQTVTSEVADYRNVNGVMIPHSVRQLVDGKEVARVTIDKAEFDTITDDAIFQMPK